jgi:hypothetical protein
MMKEHCVSAGPLSLSLSDSLSYSLSRFSWLALSLSRSLPLPLPLIRGALLYEDMYVYIRSAVI